LTASNRHLLARKLRQDGLGVDSFLHDGKSKRHVDGAKSTRRTGDDASLDAHFHSHDAGRDPAFTCRADDRNLITQVKRRRLALTRLAADHHCRGAAPYFDAGAFNIGVRIGGGTGIAGRRLG
jgi:hypothetical protein